MLPILVLLISKEIILKNVNLEINKGDKIGVFGHSGSGKTTLFNILSGVEESYYGEVNIGETVSLGYVDQSRDDLNKNPDTWKDFKTRFIELIKERYNVNSMRVKKILDPEINDEILIKSLLTLALCNSNGGFQKLRTTLLKK